MTETINRRRFTILLASALALLAILGALFLPDRAQAQSTTEIWSATMTPAVITTGNIGYSQPGGDGTLSDRTFSHAGTNYTIIEIFTQPEGTEHRLHFALNETIQTAAVSDLTLVAGSDEFVWATGTISPSGKSVSWHTSVLSWSAGTDVSLSLKAITGRPELRTGSLVRDSGDLFLLFDEDLSDVLPPKSAFTITADGSPISVGSVSHPQGDSLRLAGLSPSIGEGQTVELEYTDPTTGDDTNAIQDTGGVDAASFTIDDVTNRSSITLPALSAAAVPADGGTVALTFSRDLDFSGTFTATIRDAFSVTVDGTANAVTGFSGSGETATLTVSDEIEGGQTVVVGYDRSDAGGEALADDDDDKKQVADFTTGEDGVPAVTNNSTAGPAKLASATVNADGTELALTFDKALNAVSQGEIQGIQNRFTATAEGVEVAITGSQGLTSADDTFKLLFSTSAPVYKDEAVVLTYVKPTGSDGLTDEANDLPVVSFTTGQDRVPAVTNNSTVVAPPRLATAEVQAGGNEIYLGFSSGLDVPATVAEALKDAFTVTVDGEERAFADLEFFGLGDTFVKLVFTETLILAGASVVVSYDQSDAGTSALEGTASNKVLDFTTGAGGVVAVTNNSDTRRLLGSEFRLASANGNSVGIWSNGTTVWVADSSDAKLYAYALDDGTRQDGNGGTTDVEFDLHSDNGSARGMWSDGTTIWVADSGDDKLYAYALDDGTRQDGTGGTTNMEFDLDSDNEDATGIWSDGTTIWVANLDAFGSEVFAYALAGGTRQDGTGSTTDMEFDLDSDNGAPVGMWSDTTTIWVADSVSDQVYAYQMSDKSRDESKEFDFDSGNTDPWGIWSDYSTMWVVDAGEKDLFAYLLVGTATAPEAPTGLTATALGATIVDLAWTAPADDGGAAITGYKVEVSNDGSSGWSDLEDDTGNANAWYRHSGLSNGDTRHYRVSAINAAGASPASDTANATTMTGAHHAAPGTIYGDVLLSATLTVGTTPTGSGYVIGPPELGSLSSDTFEYGGTTFTLSSIRIIPVFDALSFGYGAPLGSGLFTMHAGPQSDEFAGGPVANSDTLSGFTSNWQHGDTVDIRLVLATAPAKPTNLTATAAGNAQIDLAWTAPVDDGGRAVTGYRVEVSEDGSTGSWSDLVADTGSTDTEYSHTGLFAGQTRHYRVSAINAAGTSEASDSDSATTSTTCTLETGDLWCGVVTVGEITLDGNTIGYGFSGTTGLSDTTFDIGPNSYTFDSIVVGAGATFDGILYVSLTSALDVGDQAKLVLHVGSRSFAFDDATGPSSVLHTYEWSMSGLDWSGAGSVTLRLRLAAPGAPTNLMAEADGSTKIDLTWTAPADDGGSAITGYRIEVSNNGSSNWSDLVADTGSDDTSYTHTGLSPGDTRHYRVSAITANGRSEPSDSDDATTEDPPRLSSAEVPPGLSGSALNLVLNEQPHGLSSVVSASIEAAFTLTADGVEIEIAHIRRVQRLLQISFAPAQIYSGQTVVVSYDKSVAGSDAIADSNGDEVASFTTGRGGVPAVVNNSNVMAPLLAPTGFRAEAGDGEVTLSWDPPGSGSGVTHHDYRFKTDGSYGGWNEIDDSGPGETNEGSFTVTTDIVNGAAHTFQLRAGNADDDSPAAVSEEVTPMEVALDPPTNLGAAPGDRQAVLTWTPPAADSGYTQHQYRYREGDGNWERWKTIPDSGPGEANGRRFTVTDLRNAVEHSFELRASDGGAGRSRAAETEVTSQGPPRIEGVEVVSSPGLDNGTTYGAGEEIRIAVTFDQDVAVTGNPRFRFDLGASDRQAGYDTGNGTETLVFVYRVRAGDRDDDGIWIGANVIRLNGGGIGNGEGHDAQLAHEGIGQLPGHKVNGAREVGMHEHEAFTHGHSHFNNGKGYYTEEYPSHEHEGHEHPDEANGHRSLNGPLEVHIHHLPEDPNSSVSGGPDERGHGGVEHVHRCYSLKPSCNQGYDYNRRGGELGLPIEVTHSHAADSEPGHGFDWDEWFEGRGPDATGASVSVADAEAVGGEDAHLRFVVTLEPAQAFAVRVDYATADATATAGEDYRETSGVLEIPPGETRATVRVPVRDRAPDDGDETLTLTLNSATAATVADGEATGAIRAPEATPPPEIDDIDVVSTPRLRSDGNEKDTYGEGENIRIEVEFDQLVLVEGDPVMMLEVCDPGGSLCEAEARYESGSGTDTLVFAYPVFEWDRDRNGIAIPEDPIDVSIDDLEGFRIRNAAGQEADLSHRREGTKSGHKVDGERQAGQYLWVEDAEAHEADGEMTFTVRLEPRGLGIVTVDYATRDGSARAGSDYTQTSGRLRFNPLERERTVTVPVADDAHQDDGETFRLRLSNPDGALLGDREATGTIHNSDPPALSASFPASAYASASHSGAEDRPQAVVAFSEAVAEFAADTPSVSVAGGAVASVQPHTEDGLEHAWLFVLAPDGDGDVTFALVADAACAEGGICTPDGRALTEAPEASAIPGPGEAEETAEETAEPPDKPRGLGATATHDAITLTWDDPDDDSITGYVILRRLPGVDQEGHFNELVANTGSAATTYTDNDVAAETRYTYRIKAINGAGTSERSRWVHIDTPAEPEPDSNSPATGAPTITGTVQVGETLTANTSDIADEDGLENAAFTYQWLAEESAISGATARTYTLSDSDEGKAVRVRLSFTDDAGNEESLTSAATAAVAAAEPAEPPDKPRGLEATTTHGQVVLTWDNPQDESITGYVILRRVRVNDQGGDFSVLVADTGSAATTYTDNAVAAETTYTYRIKAINEHGVSERSRWVHIDTPAAPEPEEKESAEPPDKPRGLSAAMSNGQVVLSWDDPEDDSITGYVILRRLPGVDAEGHFDELVADTGTAATTYTDSSVEAETRYTYRIKAINGAGTSERSRWVHIDTPAAP